MCSLVSDYFLGEYLNLDTFLSMLPSLFFNFYYIIIINTLLKPLIEGVLKKHKLSNKQKHKLTFFFQIKALYSG